MKKYLVYLFALASILLIGCDSSRDVSGAAEMNPITVDIYLDITVEDISTLKGLTVKFDNYDEDLHHVKKVTDNSVKVDRIILGIYSATASGTTIDTENSEYYINGNSVNAVLFKYDNTLNIGVQGPKASLSIFKEVYYCDSRPEKGGVHFHDQFYGTYDNSIDVLYLDGTCFVDLTLDTTTTKLPIWPEADGNNYAYGERVWKFPGNGTEYPLASGKSCIAPQLVANCQSDIYSPQSPTDGSSPEFEFDMNSPDFPNRAAYDTQHVFYQEKAEMGSIPQCLTSVFGDACVIFCVPGGETWDPVNDEDMKTIDLSRPSSDVYYARVPVKYVLDAVEAIDNELKMNAERVLGVLDAGITRAGTTYYGLGTARKSSTSEEDSPIIREEIDTCTYQDTNNNTGNSERGAAPVMRRNGTKVPSWNCTSQQLVKRTEQ